MIYRFKKETLKEKGLKNILIEKQFTSNVFF